MDSLENEWSVLQNQFDKYEQYSLLIKLANISLLSIAHFVGSVDVFIIVLIFIVWVQDAIWKTFQSRIEIRLIQIESAIKKGTDLQANQFNNEYKDKRCRGYALIKEYIIQSIRPTVAFPHILLTLLAILITLNKLL